jgi:DNA-binding GntR family transcriptional regulator
MIPQDKFSNESTPAPIVPQSVEVQAANWIRDAILNGQFKIGERLVEVELAERVGVSRGPIRAALLSLTTEGLVDHHPRIGRFVHVPTAEEVESVQEIRGMVEGLAARRLAERAIAKGDLTWLVDLQTLVERMAATIEESSLEVYFRLSREFHERIVRLNNSDTLSKIHEFVMNRAALFRQLSGNLPDRQRAAVKEHVAILDAIKLGNAQLAQQLVIEHSLNGMKSIQKALTNLDLVTSKPSPD